MAFRPKTRDIIFENRHSAGKALAAALIARKEKLDVVLGLTRGGVPVAFEVASAMAVPMDILVVKKLRSPFSEELAIGAVTADGAYVLHQQVVRSAGTDEKYIASELRVRQNEAVEAERQYRSGRPPLGIKGLSVGIVDDGIATGSSLEAAVLSARKRGAKRVVIAVPVGSRDGCSRLKGVADDVFCMTTPPDFWAVGMFYADFGQVSDQEVMRLLQDNHMSHQ